MVKVWRQIQENHFEEYLHRKDLYTTLLMTITKPGGVMSALGHEFESPPPPRELPSARLLRHASLLAEANNVQDYRNQILYTFGTVLKMDSTKKVCTKQCNTYPINTIYLYTFVIADLYDFGFIGLTQKKCIKCVLIVLRNNLGKYLLTWTQWKKKKRVTRKSYKFEVILSWGVRYISSVMITNVILTFFYSSSINKLIKRLMF